jgi:hypothetical protein
MKSRMLLAIFFAREVGRTIWLTTMVISVQSVSARKRGSGTLDGSAHKASRRGKREPWRFSPQIGTIEDDDKGGGPAWLPSVRTGAVVRGDRRLHPFVGSIVERELCGIEVCVGCSHLSAVEE